LEETIESSRSVSDSVGQSPHARLPTFLQKDISMEDIEAKILDCLYSKFGDLERIVQKAPSVSTINHRVFSSCYSVSNENDVPQAESAKKKLNALLIASRKSFELYTEMVLDNLFDITTETYLVIEIEKILEELKMISSITHEQGAVMNDLFSVISQVRDTTNQNYSSGTRLEHLKDLEGYIGELTKLAESTHAAVRSIPSI